jgi:hypothetical protein
MKNIIVLTFLLFSINIVNSQEISRENEASQFKSVQVIKVENLNKNQLFDKATEWIALTYNSAQDVIQYSNKESGKIICKGAFPTNLFLKSGSINHTLTLEFKDGRYKQTYSNFSYFSTGSGKIAFESKNLGFKKKIFKETNNKIKLATLSLKEYMLNGKSNDNW